jgi:hypothetical protein
MEHERVADVDNAYGLRWAGPFVEDEDGTVRTDNMDEGSIALCQHRRSMTALWRDLQLIQFRFCLSDGQIMLDSDESDWRFPRYRGDVDVLAALGR